MGDVGTTVKGTATGGHPYLDKLYAATNLDDTRKLYDEWAALYDKDMLDTSQNYVGPILVAEAAAKEQGVENKDFLDAGCGTGLVGAALANLGAKVVDGVDLSPGMLGIARKTGAYRKLDPVDLTKPLFEVADDTYDAVTCAGTFTHGHVGPEALIEFVRIVKPGGSIVATVLDDIWQSEGFDKEVDRLVQEGKIQLVSAEVGDYRKAVSVSARLLVIRVL